MHESSENGNKIILRRIWLISANKTKPSESICKQSSQTQTRLIKVTNIYSFLHTIGFRKTFLEFVLKEMFLCYNNSSWPPYKPLHDTWNLFIFKTLRTRHLLKHDL